MSAETLSLVIAPKREILRDFRANSGPILIALAGLVVYTALSSALIGYLESWSFFHAAYFTAINVTTVGFGDVTAATTAGKVVSSANAFVGLVAFGVLVALITLAFQPTEYTGRATPDPPPPSQPRNGREPSQTTDEAFADVLKGLEGVIRDNRGIVTHPLRIAVQGDRGFEAHVLVVVRRHNDE